MEQKMCDKTINLFIQELSDKQPVPGGGGASALVGALGVALLNMDAIYTTGNEKFKDVEEEIKEQIKKYNELIIYLKELVQGDADAFYPLSQCYKMPRNTDEEKRLKREALEENLYNAAMIPLQIMEKSYEALCLVDRLIRIGNKNLIGDVATGAVFLESALKGASLSVFANTSSMKNEDNIKMINEKFGGFDLVFIENGAYSDGWPYVHMKPEESAQVLKDLKAKLGVPVHWGKFDLSYHAWDEPIKRFEKAATKLEINYATPMIGEFFSAQNPPRKKWWDEI